MWNHWARLLVGKVLQRDRDAHCSERERGTGEQSGGERGVAAAKHRMREPEGGAGKPPTEGAGVRMLRGPADAVNRAPARAVPPRAARARAAAPSCT